MGNAQNLITGRNETTAFIVNNAKHRVFSADEELEMFKKMHSTTGEESLKYRNEIIMANQLYVYSLAKEYTATADLIPDLMEEGMTAMTEYIDRYDYTKGFKFITYIKPYVTRAMHDYLYKTTAIVYRHEKIMATIGKIKRFSERYYARNGYNPSRDEVVEFLESIGENTNDMSIYEDYYGDSIDVPVSSDSASGAQDTFGDVGEFAAMTSHGNGVEKEIEDEYNKNLLEGMMQCLNEREKLILELSFGLGGKTEESDSTIAMMLGLSETRVAQIKKKAIEKMKKVA